VDTRHRTKERLADGFLGAKTTFCKNWEIGFGLTGPFRVISNSGTDYQGVGWLRCGVTEDPLVRLIGFIVSLRQGSRMTLVRRDQHSNRTSDAYYQYNSPTNSPLWLIINVTVETITRVLGAVICEEYDARRCSVHGSETAVTSPTDECQMTLMTASVRACILRSPNCS
jgi:hypothetical protein